MATVILWDADSISRRIVDRVRAKNSWADILDDASDRFLIDAVAEEFSLYTFENEALTRERAWSLAQNLTTMVAGAKAYDYKPHRKVGATGYIEVSANPLAFSQGWNSYTTYALGAYVRWNKVVYISTANGNYNLQPDLNAGSWTIVNTNWTQVIGLAKWSAFTSTAGLSYVSTAPVTLTPSLGYIQLPVVQGTYRSVTYTAQGIANEEFFIANPNIDSVFYEVYRNGVQCTEFNRLVDAMPTDLAFETENARDFSGVYFKFGDDVDGVKLTAGDSIVIKYVETDGSIGNVTTQNSITTVSSAVFDLTGTLVTLSCSNTEAVAGGKDYETVDEIRENAIAYFHSGESLTFKDALQSYLSRSFAFIGKCVVWGSYEKNVDAGLDPSTFIASDQNLVFIAAITPGQSPIDILKNPDGSANSAYKTQIVTNTASKKGLTDLFTFTNVDFVPFRINSTLWAKSTVSSLAGLRQACIDLLQSTFNIENFVFKGPLFSSNLLPIVSGLDGVDHHTTYVEAFNEEVFTAGVDPGTPYSFTTQLKLWPVRNGSIRVVLTSLTTGTVTQVAQDDANGVLAGQNGFTLNASTLVTQSTGDFRLYLNPYAAGGLTGAYQNFSIKVYYRPAASEDLIPRNRNQILFLKEENVTAVFA